MGGNKSLSLLFNGSILLIILVFLGVIGSTYKILKSKEADGLEINLAGRQRLLTQQYARAIIAGVKVAEIQASEEAASGVAAPEETAEPAEAEIDLGSLDGLLGGDTGPEPVKEEESGDNESTLVRELFETTSLALKNGGETFADFEGKNRVAIAGAGDDAIVKAQEEVDLKWAALKDMAEGLLNGANASPEAISNFTDQSLLVMKDANLVVSMIQQRSEKKDQLMLEVLVGGLAAAIILGAVILFNTRRRVFQPLRHVVEFASSVSQGDLTRRIDIQSQDEVGQVGRALNDMCDNLNVLVSEIRKDAGSLSEWSTDLTTSSQAAMDGVSKTQEGSSVVEESARLLGHNSRDMGQKVELMDSDASSIAASISQISAGLNNVDRSVDQISSNANDLATAVEEVSASLAEIAHKTEKTAGLTSGATAQARTTSELVNKLGDSAEQVGDVVSLIKGVAQQTNLLALNATIEAASAGEAGKGFAVVANEVKDLARQTDQATAKIQEQVAGIQEITSQAVQAINTIVSQIGELDEDFEFVSKAFAEQTMVVGQICDSLSRNANTTGDLNQNIHQAADGVATLNEHLQNLADRTHTVAQMVKANTASVNAIESSISDIRVNVDKSGDVVDKANKCGHRISVAAGELKGALARFNLNQA